MLPEEKAKELIEKFRSLEYNTQFGTEISRQHYLAAKQCALITVDEILEEACCDEELRLYQNVYWDGEKYVPHKEWINFWQQVKEQLLKQ